MRTTTVPAQITTVEALLPPFFASAPYKIVVIVCLAVLFGTLAIRIKGKILLVWLMILARYNARPRYYLFNKNDVHLRDMPKSEAVEKPVEEARPKKLTRKPSPRLSTSDLVQIEQLIANPQANLHFRTNRKGELSVHITEGQ